MHVPTVTPDDLHAFQRNHFAGGSFRPPLGAPAKPSENTGPTGAPEDFEEDDGLGYYSDGMKRTLTDEQVAMFRHSEIYSILRQRQLAREHEQMDGETTEAQHEPESVTTSASHSRPDQGDKSSKNGQPQMAAQDLNMGQRSDHGISRKHIDRTKSTRRVTRELDNAAADDGILDYGEDDTSTQRWSQTENPKTSEPDNLVGPTPPTDTLLATEGRKIWWPTIGK